MQQNHTGRIHQAYIVGYPDGTFKPEKSVSRAEMAALLGRISEEKSSAEQKAKSFSDVSTNYWANTVIQNASKKGLIKGYKDGTFAPEKAVTRAEMAAIVSRYLALDGETSSSKLSDIVGSWAERDIKLVEQAGIMKGMSNGTFLPNKSLTRAEAVTIFNRILKRGPLHSVDITTWKDVPKGYWAFKDIEEASKDHSFVKDSEGIENLVNK